MMHINYPAQSGEPLLDEDHNVACQYFALCDRAATGIVRHPAVTALACARCADKVGAILEPVSVSS